MDWMMAAVLDQPVGSDSPSAGVGMERRRPAGRGWDLWIHRRDAPRVRKHLHRRHEDTRRPVLVETGSADPILAMVGLVIRRSPSHSACLASASLSAGAN